MTRNDVLDDDLIRRVAAARPHIDDDDLAADGVRATAIAERVLRTVRTSDPAAPDPIKPTVTSRRRPRKAGRLTGVRLLGTLGVAGMATAAALVIAGTFDGPDSTGTQPARADVFTLTADAMMGGPGTVVVEKFHQITYGRHPSSYDQTIVSLTPSGSGTEQILNAGYPIGKVWGTASLAGHEQVYVRSTNTVYDSSIWGPYIHRTSTGGYVYRAGPGTPLNPDLHSFKLTAAQAAGLRRGTLQIELNAQQKWHVGPVLRAQSETQSLVESLRKHAFTYDGRTTLNGRTVQKFSGTPWKVVVAHPSKDFYGNGGIVLYVNPKTHLPIEERISRGSIQTKQIWTQYRVLALTRASAKLVTLQSQYPTAKLDRSHADYLKAAHGVEVFTGF